MGGAAGLAKNAEKSLKYIDLQRYNLLNLTYVWLRGPDWFKTLRLVFGYEVVFGACNLCN